MKNGVLSIRQSKGGSLVEIPLHPRLQAILESLPKNNPAFLITEFGKAFTPKGFGTWFGDCTRAAGLRDGFEKGEKGFSSHGLRKAMCRRLADAGCDALQIMAITGHKDIKQIMVYIEARDRNRAAAVAIRAIGGYGDAERSGSGAVNSTEASLQSVPQVAEIIKLPEDAGTPNGSASIVTF